MPVRRGHVAPQNSYIETIIRKFDELSKCTTSFVRSFFYSLLLKLRFFFLARLFGIAFSVRKGRGKTKRNTEKSKKATACPTIGNDRRHLLLTRRRSNEHHRAGLAGGDLCKPFVSQVACVKPKEKYTQVPFPTARMMSTAARQNLVCGPCLYSSAGGKIGGTVDRTVVRKIVLSIDSS